MHNAPPPFRRTRSPIECVPPPNRLVQPFGMLWERRCACRPWIDEFCGLLGAVERVAGIEPA